MIQDSYCVCTLALVETPNIAASERTGNPRAVMRWSIKGYALHVVYGEGQKFNSWPSFAGIPFGNLSKIPGGQGPLYLLLTLWNLGILRLEDASEEERELAKRNHAAVLPGSPPVLPAPLCWGPYGTNQIGKATGRKRVRAEVSPYARARREKRGPKTPKLILDSDVEEEISSEDEL